MLHRNLFSINTALTMVEFFSAFIHSATDLRFSGAGKGPTSTAELGLVFCKESPLFSDIRLYYFFVFPLSPFLSGGVYIFYISDFFFTPGSVPHHSVILHINSELGVGKEDLD